MIEADPTTKTFSGPQDLQTHADVIALAESKGWAATLMPGIDYISLRAPDRLQGIPEIGLPNIPAAILPEGLRRILWTDITGQQANPLQAANLP